jgi:spermidine/putrescine transport system ATP-binding protein
VASFIGESNIIEAVMKRDLLVSFDGQDFECVDKGFKENEDVEVVIRPEDIDIVKPEEAKLTGVVKSIIFKGVHHEIVVETKNREYLIHTTDYFEPGLPVGLRFGPDDIHVMYRMDWVQ